MEKVEYNNNKYWYSALLLNNSKRCVTRTHIAISSYLMSLQNLFRWCDSIVQIRTITLYNNIVSYIDHYHDTLWHVWIMCAIFHRGNNVSDEGRPLYSVLLMIFIVLCLHTSGLREPDFTRGRVWHLPHDVLWTITEKRTLSAN